MYILSKVASCSFWPTFSNKQICFGVGVSGSIFCVIRSAPLYGYGREGPVIFADEGREQFLIEGIIISALTVRASLNLLLKCEQYSASLTSRCFFGCTMFITPQ